MKRSKYNARPAVVDGIRFASQSEAKRDWQLQQLAKAGIVKNIKRQPRYPLVVCGVKVGTYVGDWEYIDMENSVTGKEAPYLVCEDRKGVLTPLFKLKWKIVQALYPDVEFRLS
jgi:hypothetical protein